MASLLVPAAPTVKISLFSSPSSPKLSISVIALRSRAPTSLFPEIPTMKRTQKRIKAVALANTEEMVSSDSDEKSVLPKKVLVPIGFGTEEMEAVILVDVLRRAGAEVTVASVEAELEVEASGGTRLVADTSIFTCVEEVYDLVALPGGMPGSVRLRDCETLQRITSKQAEEGKLYGAICTAPAVTLLPWGLLKTKKATCHPAFFDKLPTFRAVKSKISVSKGMTTSRGAGTSFDFALSFVDQLFGESVAKEIGESLFLHTADGDVKNKEFNNVDWPVGLNPSVLIPVANGSEAIEVVIIADILSRAKVDVTIASVEKSLKIVTSQGAKIVADKFLRNVADSVYDLIILPGGTVGTEKLQKSRILKKLLKEQESSGRVYGAIGSAPAILHKHGLLKDKRVTAHPSTVSKLADGAVEGAKVVVDGKLITSRGLATAIDFTLAIVSKLFGYSRARSIAAGLVYLEFSK